MNHSEVAELASQCIERLEAEGEQAIDEICEQHPEHAPKIRGMVRQLRKLGLVEDAVEDLPEIIGDYRIRRRLGGGGMGVVYLAEQRSLGRQVALKLMRTGILMQGSAKERFRREIEAISQLDHPGICTVYEAGEAEGMPYLAMRYIEGESLAEVLASKRRSLGSKQTTSGAQDLTATLLLIEKVARALHTAHDAGLIHRDVKPANIMIDPQGEPIVLDFGLARAADGKDPGLTASGEQLGTPAYMAPEQVSGKPVDRRTDVYALGATLYECLTLHKPFEAGSREDLYRKILGEEPSDPKRWNRWIGSELKIVLAKALHKDSTQRFATALDLAEELNRIRMHEPIRTKRPPLVSRVAHWSRRNRAASGILMATTIGLLTTTWFLQRSLQSERQMRALAFIQAANEVKDVSPELAIKLAREALRLDVDSSTILGRTQEILFRLRENQVLCDKKATLHRVLFSPDGQFLLVMGETLPSSLYRRTPDFPTWKQLFDDLPRANHPLGPAAFSKDSKELALGSGRSVYRFDLTQDPPRRIRPELAHAETVLSVSYPRSQGSQGILVSHGFLQPGVFPKATLWVSGHPKALQRESKPARRWMGSAFLSQGGLIAIGSLWDGQGRWIRDLTMPKTTNDALLRIAEGPKHFLTWSWNGPLRLYNHAGDFIHEWSGKPEDLRDQIAHVEINPRGETILVVTQRGLVRILDLDSRSMVGQWRPQQHRTMVCARFSPDGERVVTGNWEGGVQIWDLKGRLLDTLRGHRNGITWMAWSPQGQGLASCGWDGTARFWSMDPPAGVAIYTGQGWPNVARSPSAEQVVFTSDTGQHQLCTASGERLKNLDVGKAYSFVEFSQDGRTAIIANQEGQIYFWDIGDPGGVRRDSVPEAIGLANTPPQRLADGTWLLRSRNRLLYIWEPDHEERRIRPFCLVPERGKPVQIRNVICTKLSQDRRKILMGHWFGVIQILSLEGKRLWKANERHGLVQSVRFSKDETEILSAGEDNYAYLWDLEKKTWIQRFGPHRNGATAAIFSPDERRVVTASKDGWIRVWDRETGTLLLGLPGHEASIRSIAFTATRQLVSTGADGSVRWWWLDGKHLTEELDGLDIPKLTPSEQERFPQLFPR